MSELKDKVILEIKKIYDPEIPVNIYELGLIYKIDIDNNENDELCNKCHIESVPTFILIKDRTIIDSVKGANSKQFKGMLEKLNK